MSGLVGKGIRSYKKAIVSDSNFPALGFRNFIMAFEANAMGVGAGVPVDLTSALTVPSEMVAAGFEQPDPITIGNAQLGNFRNNVIVTSNLNGILIDRISYTLTNDSITFDDGLNANEIIVIKRGNEAVTGNRIVDARPLRASGTVDFSMIGSSPVIFEVGEGFRIAPSTLATGGIDNRQIGFVQVFADGVLQARNVGNNNESMLPASEQTGNYREVIVDGLGVLLDPQNGVTANAIEFNQFQPFSAEEGVIVISTNLIVDSPNSTGVIDQVDALGARVTGVETSVAANTTRSTANTTELATIPTVPGNLTDATDYTLQVPANSGAAVWAAGGGGGDNLFQRRNLASDISATDTDITSLRFANLTIGNIYRVTMQAQIELDGMAAPDCQLTALNNSVELCSLRLGGASLQALGLAATIRTGTSVIFTAAATTVVFAFTENSTNADLRASNTFTQLEELMNYAVTTNFTP